MADLSIYTSSGSLSDYMKKKLVEHIQENLTFYQRFDSVKIYYDGGQECVSTALRNAYSQTISKAAFAYKPINASEFCLTQVADYICTIELTAIFLSCYPFLVMPYFFRREDTS